MAFDSTLRTTPLEQGSGPILAPSMGRGCRRATTSSRRCVSRVAGWRVRRGLRQQESADAVGISLASLKRWERSGDAKAPLWWYLNSAIVLNLDLSELLGELEDQWQPRPNAATPPPDELLDRSAARAEAWRDEQWRYETPS